MAKAEDIIKVAIKEIGTKENPPESNKVKYNKWYYGKDVEGAQYPWCACFVSWVFAQVDASLVKKSASCVNMADWFKQQGRFHTGKPKAGDVVFFKFGTNNRYTNHVGIVESVNANGSINTIEGNTSTTSQDNGGCVMARVRRTCIVGYGRPAYEESTISTRPTLKKGNRGAHVAELQRLLCKHGFPTTEDGIFGKATEIQVIAFQGLHGLVKDGIVGQKTWDKLGRL